MADYRQEIWQLERTIAKIDQSIGKLDKKREKAEEDKRIAERTLVEIASAVADAMQLRETLEAARDELDRANDDKADSDG